MTDTKVIIRKRKKINPVVALVTLLEKTPLAHPSKAIPYAKPAKCRVCNKPVLMSVWEYHHNTATHCGAPVIMPRAVGECGYQT